MIHDNSRDASHYRGPEDILYVIGKIGGGTWGVRPEWLKAKGWSDAPREKGSKASRRPAPDLHGMLTGEDDALERVGRITYQLPRNANRADKLKRLYHYSCQVCGKISTIEGRAIR